MGVDYFSCSVCEEIVHEDNCCDCDDCGGTVCIDCAEWEYGYDIDSDDSRGAIFKDGCPNCKNMTDRKIKVQDLHDKILNMVSKKNKNNVKEYLDSLISMI